jgi:hypothetical protein
MWNRNAARSTGHSADPNACQCIEPRQQNSSIGDAAHESNKSDVVLHEDQIIAAMARSAIPLRPCVEARNSAALHQDRPTNWRCYE